MPNLRSATVLAPSPHPGMGARLIDGGVTFRVWAPAAEAVYVTGSFNEWAGEATPLAEEADGYWSAHVPEVAAGAEYKYVLHCGPERLYRNDPYARLLTNSAGNSVVYDSDAFDWEDDAYRLPSWNELVLYELHVGTFYDPDPHDGRPGSFETALRGLDHLKRLGVNAVLLMPVTEFAGDYSWGYNPALPFAVETAYGGPDAFKRFVREAHRRGIGVLVDVVYNHFGPSDLDLWQFDGWSENGKGGIYFYNDHRSATPWGDTRPDYGRPAVRQYIRDNVFMWLEEFHVDGLRWDMTAYIRNVFGNDDPAGELPDGWSLMRAVNDEVRARFPERLLVAEDLQHNAAVTHPEGAGFGAQWDAAFVHPVRAALVDPNDEARDVGAVAAALSHRYNDDPFQRVVYTESHDEVANGKARLAEEIAPGDPAAWAAQKRATLGTALVLTAPGIPMLFQGQAFLEGGWFQDTRPLDWGKVDEHLGIVRLHHDLIALRRNRHGTTRGLLGPNVRVLHAHPEAKLLAYHRWMDGGPGDDVVVVVNLSATGVAGYRIGLPAPGPWHVRFNSDWEGYSGAFNGHPALPTEAEAAPWDESPYSGLVAVGPYSAVVLSQDRP